MLSYIEVYSPTFNLRQWARWTTSTVKDVVANTIRKYTLNMKTAQDAIYTVL